METARVFSSNVLFSLGALNWWSLVALDMLSYYRGRNILGCRSCQANVVDFQVVVLQWWALEQFHCMTVCCLRTCPQHENLK